MRYLFVIITGFLFIVSCHSPNANSSSSINLDNEINPKVVSSHLVNDSMRFDSIRTEAKKWLKLYCFSKLTEEVFPKRYDVKDSLDFSAALGEEIIVTYLFKYFSFTLKPRIDSIVHQEFLKIDQHRFDKGVAEPAIGTANYALGCLDFYESKALDSMVNKWIAEAPVISGINTIY